MKTNLMRTLRILAIAMLAYTTIAALAPTANAAKNKAPKVAKAGKLPSYHGHVTAVDATAGTITIKGHKQDAKTFTVNSSTKVVFDKQASTLSAIQVGYPCHIQSADGTTAAVIHSHTPKPHIKTPKGAAKPATL